MRPDPHVPPRGRPARRGTFVAASLGAAFLLLSGSLASATPDWRTKRMVGSLIICADDRAPNRYYFAPPEIAVAMTDEGKPDFRLLETRYTGSAVARDRGTVQHKSLVTFRVRLPRVQAEELAQASRTLGGRNAPAELRPFPVRKLSTALVYSVIGAGETRETTPLPEGRFESAPDASEMSGDSYWTERIYTIGLDSLTAQAFRAALEKDQVFLSLGYAFLGHALGEEESPGELTGSPELVSELKKSITSQRSGPDSTLADSLRLRVIRAGAIEIGLDVKRWPDLMRRVDLNDRAPPGYAALDVYCYDFNNDLRPDLAEKRVEIDAEGVAGKRVKLHTQFRREQADLYASSIRFPVAVRLDRPYRYRVNEVKQDGVSRASPWREVASWSRILDVTTPAKEAGVRSILGP